MSPALNLDQPSDAKSAAQAAPFAFDAPHREVTINATPDRTGEEAILVKYRLAKPTKAQDAQHQRLSAIRTEATGRNTLTRTSGTAAANQELFKQCAKAVHGLDFEDGSNPLDWVELTPERMKKLFDYYSDHATAAIDALYEGTCIARQESSALKGEPDQPKVLRFQTGPRWYDLLIGNRHAPAHTVSFQLGRPTEKAWKALDDSRALNDTEVKGKESVGRTVTNRAAFREFLKAAVEDVEGAMVGGRTFAEVKASPRTRDEWIDEIDGLWCVEIVIAFEAACRASAQD